MTAPPVPGTWEPRPAARPEDGFLSGNGRHGALVLGDPDGERVVVTHHTLVCPNGSEHARPPRLADRVSALQDRLLAGDVTAAEGFTDGRELQWVQPFHPAFQVRLRGGSPAGEARDYRRSVDFTSGVVEAECAGWRSRVFVSRADDVIAQYVTGDTTVSPSTSTSTTGSRTPQPGSASARAWCAPPRAPCSPSAPGTRRATARTPA